MFCYSETKEGHEVIHTCFSSFIRSKFITFTREMFKFYFFLGKNSIILVNSELENVSLSRKFYALSGKKRTVRLPSSQIHLLRISSCLQPWVLFSRAVSYFTLNEHCYFNAESRQSQKAAQLPHILQHCEEVMKVVL